MAAPMWQENIVSYINNFEDSAKIEARNYLIKGIRENQLQLYEFVEQLESWLTNPDCIQRADGIKILVDVTKHLPPKRLEQKEVKFLSKFYCDKLKDNVVVVTYALEGLCNLSPYIPEEDATEVITETFTNIQNQAHPQGERNYVYNILKNLLDRNMESIKTLGNSFLLQFIDAAGGEKDPRNLILVFSMVPKIIANFNVDLLTEELFEILGCYFPVDFTPPPNDHHKITREDLKEKLHICLSCSDKLAPFVLPLISEKLDSDYGRAKTDSFDLLLQCCENYSPDQIQQYSSEFWKCIRREVVMKSNDEVEASALYALRAIVKNLAKSVTQVDSKSILTSFLEKIFKECQAHLLQSDQQLIQPCAKLLEAASIACYSSCCAVIDFVVPILLQQLTLNEKVDHKTKILRILTAIVRTHSLYPVEEQVSSPLSNLKSSLLLLYLSSLSDLSDDIRFHGLSGLEALTSIEGLLSDSDSALVINGLLEFLKTKNSLTQPNARQEAFKILRRIRDKKSDILRTNITNILENGGGHLENNLDIVGSVCATSELLPQVLPKLVKQLEIGLTSQDPTTVGQILKCIQSLTAEAVKNPELIEYLETNILHPLLEMIVQNGDFMDQMLSETVREDVQKIGHLISRNLSIQNSENLASKLIELIVDKQIESLTFRTYSESLLGSFKREAQIPRVQDLLIHLQTKGLDTNNVKNLLSICKCWAAILNKLDGDKLNNILPELTNRLTKSLDSGTDKENAFHLWIWLTKALLIAGHPMLDSYISKLINLLDDSELSDTVAAGFTTILSDSGIVLTLESHANVKIMYRQRFFQMTSPILIERFKSAPRESKPCFLTALFNQFPLVPKQVLATQLQTLFPLVVTALSNDNQQLVKAAIDTLLEATDSNSPAVEEYLDDIVGILMDRITTKNSMIVRMLVIKLLGKFAKAYPRKLVMYRKNVLEILQFCLDDKKRVIRTQAVKTRALWFLVGSPGGL